MTPLSLTDLEDRLRTIEDKLTAYRRDTGYTAP
jgi:hypothetical protein